MGEVVILECTFSKGLVLQWCFQNLVSVDYEEIKKIVDAFLMWKMPFRHVFTSYILGV